jgi:FkbM family methyltransferase
MGNPVSAYCSQHGEDHALAARFGHRRGGFYVEVGALDGVIMSNTYYFEHSLGWTGVLIEANPTEAEKCRTARPASVVVTTAVVSPKDAGRMLSFEVVRGFEALSTLRMTSWAKSILQRMRDVDERDLQLHHIQVTTATLDQVLSSVGAPKYFDFLTIDIEGAEAQALAGFSLGLSWRPAVFMIENGSGFAAPHIVAYLFRAGYGYVRSIGPNDWYEPAPVHERLRAILPLYAHHAPRALRTLARRLLSRIGVLSFFRRP